MHKEDLEVFGLGSNGPGPRYLALKYHINWVYIVQVRTLGHKEHPPPRKQALREK